MNKTNEVGYKNTRAKGRQTIFLSSYVAGSAYSHDRVKSNYPRKVNICSLYF
jgi:hypothetical protein